MNVIDFAYRAEGATPPVEEPGVFLSLPERWTLTPHYTEVYVFKVRPITDRIDRFQPVVLLTYTTASTMDYSSAVFSVSRYMMNRWEAASSVETFHLVLERFSNDIEPSGTGNCSPLADFLGYGIKGKRIRVTWGVVSEGGENAPY